ncbi:MAG: alpha/beta hydrolase [Planctomycetes bacterium]|nr:alpha/beta hydrolase [Planctomycetota bacterium]
MAFRVVEGRGPLPVVYLHGLGGSMADLASLARRAFAAGVLVDLPGFGASGPPLEGAPLLQAVEAVLAVLDRVGLDRAVWCGCSYGGHVALRAALDRPSRVAALVLVASGGLERTPGPVLAARFQEGALARRGPLEAAAAFDALVSRRTQAVARARSRWLAPYSQGARSAALAWRSVARAAAGALADDAATRLEAVEAPVELVHGALDPLVSVELAREAATRFPRARWTVLEGTGHMPWLEDPRAVAACVRRAVLRGDACGKER